MGVTYAKGSITGRRREKRNGNESNISIRQNR